MIIDVLRNCDVFMFGHVRCVAMFRCFAMFSCLAPCSMFSMFLMLCDVFMFGSMFDVFDVLDVVRCFHVRLHVRCFAVL